jgi:hypothetical protein
MLLKLIFTLPIYGIIYRVRIKSLLNQGYLLRADDKIEITNQPKLPKTDFFVDISDTKSNKKEVVLYERVRDKSPRYLVYKKDTNTLGYQDNPHPFMFIYQENVFNIDIGNNECLHVEADNKIRLMKCNTKSMNQKFTLQVLKKKSKNNEKIVKNNERMLINVEGKDYNKKDKKVHEDNVLIKYSPDEEESEVDNANEGSNGETIGFMNGDGSYKVSEEILTDIEEEPAILKTDHISKVLHSTLYTTMIINSTSTIYSTIYQTETSSVIGKKTDLVTIDPSYIAEVKPVRQLRPRKDNEIDPVADFDTKKPSRNPNMFKEPFKWGTEKEGRISKKRRHTDDSSESEHICDNLNIEECRELSERQTELREEPPIQESKGRKYKDPEFNTLYRRNNKDNVSFNDKENEKVKLRNDIMLQYFEEPKISDFIDDIPDMDLKKFIGTEKSKNNFKKKKREKDLIQENKAENTLNSENKRESLNRFAPPVEKNELEKFKQESLTFTKNNQGISRGGKSESGGLLSYIGFDGPIGSGLTDSSDDDLLSGIRLDI